MNENLLSPDKNYYFQGLWFDTLEEMVEYVKEWNNLPLDQQTAERVGDRIKKDIVMNVFLNGPRFKNYEFSLYMEKVFLYSHKLLHEYSGVENE